MKVIYTKKEDFIEVKIEMKKERLNAEERSWEWKSVQEDESMIGRN
jgi:hypothetical protein